MPLRWQGNRGGGDNGSDGIGVQNGGGGDVGVSVGVLNVSIGDLDDYKPMRQLHACERPERLSFLRSQNLVYR